MSKKNKTQIPVESKSNNHENCYNEKDYKPWCKDCVPCCITEGWTSENHEIDEFIKDTICDAGLRYTDDEIYCPKFLEWVPYDRFKDIEHIDEGGFAKVFSATWIDGQAKYKRQDDGSWKKLDPEPMKVALKRLNGSQNMSDECLNELKTHWKLNKYFSYLLTFYGMTKDPDTKEFIMITQFAEKGNLRSFLSTHFNKTLWKDKLNLLFKLISDLEHLHNLGYFHKDFHSGNILQIDDWSYISDFGLSGSSNEPKSDNKICGVLPYIAPEVLDREPYTVSSDIYSFGVIMAELSSGKPPFHERKHDHDLSLEICNGLRPKFGKGTPKIYEKLAKKCMDARPDQRPTAKGLWKILNFWHECTEYNNYQDCKGKDIEDFFEEFEFGFKGKDIKNTLKDIKDLFEEFDHKGKEIKAMFEEADKEIPNISTSYEKNPDAIYSSRILTFMPNDDENDDKDSKIHNLDINVTSCEKNPDATCTSKISTPKPIFSNIIKSNDDKFNKEASSQIADDINKILNISSLYEKIPDATCTSKISTLSNLPKPISSNIIESNDDENNDEVIDSPDSEITNLDIADYNLP